MLSPSDRSSKGVGSLGKTLIVCSIALAYATQFWPEAFVYNLGMKALGNPPYEGFLGAFLPHLLLFTTVMAAVSAMIWRGLSRFGLVPPIQLGNLRVALIIGSFGGVVAFALALPAAWLTLGPSSIRWIPPNAWKIAGNIFSNFYEEFVYRGFSLASLRVVAGFWPAAIVTSVMWAGLHIQYPLGLRLYVALIGIGFCWLVRRAQSFWAPYAAHMVMDLLADCFIG